VRNLIFIASFLFAIVAHSQLVTVVDATSNEPLINVAVYNKSKSNYAITDIEGQVDLEVFKLKEAIYFQSVAYQTLKTTRSQIINNGNVVKLNSQSQQINPVILSASKFEQRMQDVPQKIFAINKEEIAFNNSQTSADLLQQSGKVFVQKSQQGGGSPMIRGFSTNRLLLTVDGVRMNNAIFRSGNLQNVISIDPLSIDRTEVILGPGSVVYGSDAIGGVMNFYTVKPHFENDSLQISGNALLRYATANNENTAHARFNIGSQKFAAATSLSFNFYDDMRMGSYGPDDYLRPQFVQRVDGQDVLVDNSDPQVQRPSGYDQLNLLQKFRYQPHQNLELGLSLIYTATSDVPRYDVLTRFRTVSSTAQAFDNYAFAKANLPKSGDPRSAEWFYGPQTWLMTNFKMTHRGNGKWYDTAKFTQAFQQFQESRNNRDFQDPNLFINEERVDVVSTSLDFERRNRESNVLFYGAEFFHNRVHSQGRVTDIDTGETQDAASRYPDGSSWRSLAAYASYQWKPQTDLTFNIGLRYNHIWSDATFDDRFFDFPFSTSTFNTGALTGALGATYLPGDDWELRANLGTAFRAPNIDDKAKIFDPNPGTVIVPNPDLESEYAYNAEIGVKKSFNNKLFLDVSAYYTFLDDALVTRNFNLNGQEFIEYQGELSRVQAIQNADEAIVYGIELGMQYNITDHWKMRGNYSWINGEQTDSNGDQFPVRHVSPAFGDVHVIYQKGRLKLNAFLAFNGQFEFNDLSPSQQSRSYLFALDENGNPFSPRWYTVNIRGSYELNKSITFNAAVENLTDQRYRTYSSGVAAAGRNLILSFNYSF